MLKLLHISDLHLGAKFGFLRDKAAAHRNLLLKTFAKAVDIAIEREVHAILLVGDTFDHYYPDQLLVDEFASIIQRATTKSIYVFILPGNHDRLEENSVWATFQTEDKFVKVFAGGVASGSDVAQQPQVYTVPELKLNVIARPVFTQKTTQSPLAGVAEVVSQIKQTSSGDAGSTKTIVLAHGSVDLHGNVANFPIGKDEIAQLGADYLALGDWHGLLDVSQGEQTAYYPGSAEVLKVDQDKSGSCLYLELSDDGKVRVVAEKLSSLKILHKEYNLAQLPLGNALQELKALAEPHLLLSVKFTGAVAPDLAVAEQIKELTAALEGSFYYLSIDNKTELTLDFSDTSKFPEKSVPYEFMRMVQKKLEAKEYTPDLAQKVLSLGMQIILRDHTE